MQEPPHHHASRTGWIAAGGLIVAAALLIAFRQHAFDLPLETDECNYAYIAARLLEGQRLYVDVWDHQPPGVFVMYAGLIGVFGDSPTIFRWTSTAFSLVSMLLIYGIVRRTAGLGAGLAAAVLFAAVSADPGTGGEGANREIYMNACALAAWYCALRWASPHVSSRGSGNASGMWLVAAGAALGLGSTIKTVLAVHWLGLAVCVVLIAGSRAAAGRRRRTPATSLLLLGAAPAAIWLGMLAYFAAVGRFEEFYDAVFRFNLGYSEGGKSYFSRFWMFFEPPRHPFVFESGWPLWIAAEVAVAILIVRTAWSLGRRRLSNPANGQVAGTEGTTGEMAGLLVVGLVVASYLAVCLPGRFWPHYYYLLVPSAVIAISVGAFQLGQLVAYLLGKCGRDKKQEAVATLSGYASGVLLLAVVTVTGVWQYRHYLSLPLFGVTVHRYNSRDFWGRAQGQNVARVTEPGDSVFVFGNEAEIYYYSGRRCASRYTMITGLADGLPGVEQRRRILLDELKVDPPRLIMVLFDVQPWVEWREFLLEHYGQPVGWDYHDRTGQPIMFVLARKDRPIESIDWNWDRSSVGGWHLGDERR